MKVAQKYALISVSDKTNLEHLGQFLLDQDYNIISTGGTFSYLQQHVSEKHHDRLIQVSDFTGFPEILGGRVKTLHPKIYGSLLARRDSPEHMAELVGLDFPLIDIVVCNLYPFHLAIKGELPMDQALELIDIGGVTLIRASAKNWKSVLTITDPSDYPNLLSNFANFQTDTTARHILSIKAFEHTAEYDTSISNYLSKNLPFSINKILTPESTVQRSYQPEISLKYGCNPHQKGASFMSIPLNYMVEKKPFTVINGDPGYINILDALNSWQLVNELRQTLNLPAAASFKHTSPAGAAVYHPLSELQLQLYAPPNDLELSPLAVAFLLARNSDPMSSFGDFIALSDVCDLSTALLIKREVSDGVIAPGYTHDALAALGDKKGGKYLILQMDQAYQPKDEMEYREIYGFALAQERNQAIVKMDIFQEANLPTENKEINEQAKMDLILANLTLKYAQSNNVVMAKDGQVIGVAAGQQSRVDAVKLAGKKAQTWYLRQHPSTLALMKTFRKDVGVKRQDKNNAMIRFVEGGFTDLEFESWRSLFENRDVLPMSEEDKASFMVTFGGVSMASDAFFPFRDNIDHASKFGVKYVMQPGGSTSDPEIIKACDQYGMAMVFTGKRMFTH